MLLSLHNITLPIEDPVLKFLLVLVIILGAPLLLNKIKVPHLIGLIIAGAAIGPNGFNVLSRDSSIVTTGTTGLLYIMFLAGLEIDLGDFKKNKWKSMTFGLYTFAIPFILGIISGHLLFNFSWLTSIVFASIFSSHTLISYPIVSKFGIAKSLPVNITVGGTMITDILALTVLAICVGVTQGEINNAFWIKLSISILIFGAIVLTIFPIIGRWFFKKVSDSISQYIFVLVMIYLAAVLAELAGVESIIGAFLAGLALNRLIPHTSALMNRVEFVGNAIFIPFFLISVGMIIDMRVFFNDIKTIEVALLMTGIGIAAKYFAAIATAKTFRLTKEQGNIIFGLSSSHAAATLAIVLVGYNIILGETETGEPIRLLNESVLNGSILLILISCTVSSFVTQKNTQKIVKEENENTIAGSDQEEENILLALNHLSTVENVADLALIVKSKSNSENISALNIINEEKQESSVKNAEKIMKQVVSTASAADVTVQTLIRYDNDVINGINNVVKEQKITDLIVALENNKGFSSSFVDNLYNGYLQNNDINTLVYHSVQPISTIKRYMVMIPADSHKEAGFFHALLRIWNIGRNSGALLSFYAREDIIELLQKIVKKANVEAEFIITNFWVDAEKTAEKIQENEGLIVIMAKRGMISYFPKMSFIPEFLNKYVSKNNYLLIFPYSKISEENNAEIRSVRNHGDFAEIGNIIKKIFK